jgi:hypothetical protein
VCCGLGRYCGVHADTLQFSVGSAGKPRVARGPATAVPPLLSRWRVRGRVGSLGAVCIKGLRD